MVVRFIATVLALVLATLLVPGIRLQPGTAGAEIVAMTVVAVIFGAANSAVKPLFRFWHTPVRMVLLAVALLVANAGLLLLTSWICGLLHIGWRVDGVLPALVGGLIVGVVSFLVNALFGRRGEEHR